MAYPDGELLPTSAAGLFMDAERGEEVQRDEQGVPVDAKVGWGGGWGWGSGRTKN